MTKFHIDEHWAGSGIHRSKVWDVRLDKPGSKFLYRAASRSQAQAFIDGYRKGQQERQGGEIEYLKAELGAKEYR